MSDPSLFRQTQEFPGDPSFLAFLADHLGNLRVFDVVSLSVSSLSDPEALSRQILPRDVADLSPSSWFMEDEKRPWLALFVAMDDRMARIESVLERLSRGEPVTLPHPREVVLSDRGILFPQESPRYCSGDRLRLVMDLSSFPPCRLQVFGVVRSLVPVRGGDASEEAVLVVFEGMDGVQSEALIRYLVVKSRSVIRKVRN